MRASCAGSGGGGRDEVETDVGDAGGAEAGDFVEADLRGVEAADGGGFAVDEGLDAERDAVESVMLEGFEGLGGELAGGALEGDLGGG